MERLLLLFSGRVRVEIFCTYPERFINICAQNGIAFSDLEYTESSAVRVTVSLADYKKLKRLIGRNFSMRAVRKRGAPFVLYGIRRRYALLAGMAVCFFAVWILSMFIWQIEVTGNKSVPGERILSELDDIGIGIGTCSFTIDQDVMENEMLLRIPELSWIAVNVNGAKAEVKVREAVEPPQMVEKKTPTLVYAAKSGLITGVTVLEGQTECAVGETVSAGDVLVTGVVGNKFGGYRVVHAMGKITARTWYDEEAFTPSERLEKVYTGEERTKTTIIIADKRINLYFDSGISWEDYDKITTRNTVTLFGRYALPICVEKTVFTRYVTRAAELDGNEYLESFLTRRIGTLLTDGEIRSAEFTHGKTGGVLTAGIHAECSEQIGVMRDLTAEELERAGNGG